MKRKTPVETIPITVELDLGTDDGAPLLYLAIDLKKKFLVDLNEKYKDSDRAMEALYDELIRSATEYVQTHINIVVDDIVLESVLAESLR